MTELNRLLQESLSELSLQYKKQMTHLQQQIEGLSSHVKQLERQQIELLKEYQKVAELLKEELQQ
jgi:NAD-specific glutamate dehydrogenase